MKNYPKSWIFSVHYIIESLYDKYGDDYLNFFKEYCETHDDIIANKWLKFIIKLKNRFNSEAIDIHCGNFGIDKNGDIKLLALIYPLRGSATHYLLRHNKLIFLK